LPFSEVCRVDPLDPTDEIAWSECVDYEVRVELKISCSLVSADAKRVNVSTTVKLFEETTCSNHDLDGQQFRATPPFSACEDGCDPTFLNSPSSGPELVVSNDDEAGDNATWNISMRNIQQIEQP
jgi:hypothetical protein